MKIQTNNKVCILCLERPPIENSHIVPKLVLKWIFDNAPVEHLRWSSIPNKPFQDGWKADYFCTECEGRLAKVENLFKTDFFDPIVAGKVVTVDYTEFLIPFSLSLYFRHLKFSLDQDPAYKSKDAFSALLERMRSVLFAFLFKGDFPDIHSYVVYLPFVDQSPFFEPGVNQYILAVDGFWFDYHIPPDKVFLIGGVKLPKLQFVFSEQPLETVARDEEGKVELSHARIKRVGTFEIGNVSHAILPGLFGEDYNCRAIGLTETTNNLSERQEQGVVDEIASHPSPESTIFHEAYEYDRRLAAFKEKVQQQP